METRWGRYSEKYKEYYKLNPEEKLNKNLDWKLRNPNKFLYNSCKQRAKKLNIEFKITADDIKVPEFCPILNRKLEFGTQYSPSVDRIDNSKGYVPNNIIVISQLANRMKNSATEQELRLFCSNMIKVLDENVK